MNAHEKLVKRLEQVDLATAPQALFLAMAATFPRTLMDIAFKCDSVGEMFFTMCQDKPSMVMELLFKDDDLDIDLSDNDTEDATYVSTVVVVPEVDARFMPLEPLTQAQEDTEKYLGMLIAKGLGMTGAKMLRDGIGTETVLERITNMAVDVGLKTRAHIEAAYWVGRTLRMESEAETMRIVIDFANWAERTLHIERIDALTICQEAAAVVRNHLDKVVEAQRD